MFKNNKTPFLFIMKIDLKFNHLKDVSNPEQVLAATPHKTPTVRPPAPYHENYSS